MSFCTYEKLKNSEIDWLGEVPHHWNICRIIQIADSEKTLVQASELADKLVFHYSIPVVQATGTGQVEDGNTIDSSKLIVSVPQVLISKLNPRKATVCIARPQGELTVCSTEFVSLVPRHANLRYLFYVALSEPFRQRLEAFVESATKSHQRVSPSDILKSNWPFPPLAEQTAIVAFLHHETTKIDALVEEQKWLIDLLREKREAVITRAVTKGLDPNVPMKHSGVEWLGEVPEHWEVRKISSLSTKITNGYVGPTRDILVDDGVRYLQSLHIKDNSIRFDTPYFVREDWSKQHDKSILETGDVLIVQTGDIGQVAVVTDEYAGCNCHALIIVSPMRSIVSGDWIAWVLNGNYGYHSLLSIQTGALHPHLNCGNVKYIFLPVPPIAEQLDIIRFISVRLEEFGRLIAAVEAAIALLQERRSALISAAVTGKIDVRGLVPVEAEAA